MVTALTEGGRDRAVMRIVARAATDPPERWHRFDARFDQIRADVVRVLKAHVPGVRTPELIFRTRCAAGMLNWLALAPVGGELRGKSVKQAERLLVPSRRGLPRRQLGFDQASPRVRVAKVKQTLELIGGPSNEGGTDRRNRLHRIPRAGGIAGARPRGDRARPRTTPTPPESPRAGVTPAVVDLYDRPAVVDLLNDADGAIHTASPGDATSADLDSAVVDAAIEAFDGTGKPYLHISGALGLREQHRHQRGVPVRTRPRMVAWKEPIEKPGARRDGHARSRDRVRASPTATAEEGSRGCCSAPPATTAAT